MEISEMRRFLSQEGVFIVSAIAAIFIIPEFKRANWGRVFSILLVAFLIITLFTGGDLFQPIRWLAGLFGWNF